MKVISFLLLSLVLIACGRQVRTEPVSSGVQTTNGSIHRAPTVEPWSCDDAFPTMNSGIKGVVVQRPYCPSQNCGKPEMNWLGATVDLFANDAIIRTVTAKCGGFYAELPSGEYVVAARSSDRYLCPKKTILIRANQVAGLSIFCDERV